MIIDLVSIETLQASDDDTKIIYYFSCSWLLNTKRSLSRELIIKYTMRYCKYQIDLTPFFTQVKSNQTEEHKICLNIDFIVFSLNICW